MTAVQFRNLVLALPGAVESAHMGHPDFRAGGRIFATLHKGEKTGMVKLSPQEQERFVAEHPAAFSPESGAWGRMGCTRVALKAAPAEALGEALTLAWKAATAPRPKTRSRSVKTSR